MTTALQRGYIYGTSDTILEAVCLILEPSLPDDGMHDIGSLDIGNNVWLTREPLQHSKLIPNHPRTGKSRYRPCVRLTSEDEICLLATFGSYDFRYLPALLQHFLIPVDPNMCLPLGMRKPLLVYSDPGCPVYRGLDHSWLICMPYQSEAARLTQWSWGYSDQAQDHPNPYYVPERAMLWLGHDIERRKADWINRLKRNTSLRQQMYDEFILWYDFNKGTPTEYTFPPQSIVPPSTIYYEHDHWQPTPPTTSTVQTTIQFMVADDVFPPSVVDPLSEVLADNDQPSITEPMAAQTIVLPARSATYPLSTGSWPTYFGRIRNRIAQMGLSQPVRGPVLLADNQIKMPTFVVEYPRAESEDELGHATPYGEPSDVYNPHANVRKTQSLGGVTHILKTQLHVPVKITFTRAYKKVVLFCMRWRVRQSSTMMTDFGERRMIIPREPEATSILGGDILGSPRSMYKDS